MTSALLNVEIGVLAPKQIIFNGSGYSPATNNVIEKSTPTTSDLTISGVTDTSAQQSVKVDLGSLRASEYALKAVIEFFAAPTAGDLIHFFWSSSESATAAVGNDGGTSGADAAYSGYSSDLEESVRHLVWIGSMAVTPSIAVQGATVGTFRPPSRYGSLVIWNKSGETLAATDGVESAIVLNPILMQGQNT